MRGIRTNMRPLAWSALLASTMLAGVTPAFAADVAAAPAGSTALSEVIVTAEKREENLQSVTMSDPPIFVF